MLKDSEEEGEFQILAWKSSLHYLPFPYIRGGK